MDTPIVGTDNFAPKPQETGNAYAARMQSVNASDKVKTAAKIIATAMQLEIYNPYAEKKDTFAMALDNITNALKGFSTTQNLAGARDDLMQAAIEGVQKKIGRKIDIKTARTLISGKAEKDVDGDLANAVAKTWAEIREASGVEEGASNKKVVDSYKDMNEAGKLSDTDLSRLAQDVLTLRDKFRDTRKK